jgi:hypothetical protein
MVSPHVERDAQMRTKRTAATTPRTTLRPLATDADAG